MKFHLSKVELLLGFAAENAKRGDKECKILMRAWLTSDKPMFHKYVSSFSAAYLQKHIQPDTVYRFLILVHEDLSADIYVNDFNVTLVMRLKRSVIAGDVVMRDDVADISEVTFDNIEIKDTDSLICYFKVDWRDGLFFDIRHPIEKNKLDINGMQSIIGGLYRYLYFYHIYETLESGESFKDLMNDGWFPFVEIINREYQELVNIYKSKFETEYRIKELLASFNSERIQRIKAKWSSDQVFSEKQFFIDIAIDEYLKDTPAGYFNCIKNLLTEIEGLMRLSYMRDTGKGDKVGSRELINHLIEQANSKTGPQSLYLPTYFLQYLKEVVFAGFNIETGQVNLSRHSSSHGVANPEDYTKARALQLILIWDQIWFYVAR